MKTELRGLSVRRLRRLLDYNPETGVFRWKPNPKHRLTWNTRFAGSIAGTINKRYREIGIDDQKYLAHRLAWFYVNGRWPKLIDHIDMNGHNNAIRNLREATHSTNKANRRAPANNSSGYKGVSFNKVVQRYQASICRQYKQMHLGFFATAREAHAAYCSAAKALFGEYSRTV